MPFFLSLRTHDFLTIIGFSFCDGFQPLCNIFRKPFIVPITQAPIKIQSLFCIRIFERQNNFIRGQVRIFVRLKLAFAVYVVAHFLLLKKPRSPRVSKPAGADLSATDLCRPVFVAITRSKSSVRIPHPASRVAPF